MESLERGGQAAREFGGRPVVNAGEVMKPLVSEQVEVGVKVSLGGMLLSTALFQIDKGLQYYDVRNPAAPVFVQDGRQVHRGIEFTAFGRLAERWSLVGGLTLLDAVVRRQKQNPALEGKRPAALTGEVAERLARLRAEYDTPWLPGLTLVGGVSYTSDRYADPMNTDRLPSFTLFDAGARYAATLAGRPVTERYWPNGWHIGDPRVFTFSLSAPF
jgi:iron complex outermembrane receptor protein